MSRLLVLALFCTSALACTKAAAPHATTPSGTLVPPPTPEPRQDELRQELRQELAAARSQNLARLQTYAETGAFPTNQTQPGLLNVFRDAEGHLCAVANLINLDGHTDLIDTTAGDDNFIVLAEVDSGPLLGWILESGFTQEEIGMIQVPYMGEFEDGEFGELPVLAEPQLAEMRSDEVARVRAALIDVHRNISANTLAALDLAVQRSAAGTVIAQVSPTRFAQPQRFAQPPQFAQPPR